MPWARGGDLHVQAGPQSLPCAAVRSWGAWGGGGSGGHPTPISSTRAEALAPTRATELTALDCIERPWCHGHRPQKWGPVILCTHVPWGEHISDTPTWQWVQRVVEGGVWDIRHPGPMRVHAVHALHAGLAGLAAEARHCEWV